MDTMPVNTMQIRLSDKPFSAIYTAYKISIESKEWQYLKFSDFLRVEIEVWIEFLRKLSPYPIIQIQSGDKGLDLVAIDNLAPNESWDNKLRIHHALGRLFADHCVPTYPYESFHDGLMLNSYNFDEFQKAWVKESIELGQDELRQSLDCSAEHIKFFRTGGRQGYYFKKTAFVLDQLPLALEKKRMREEAIELAKKEAAQVAARLMAERPVKLSETNQQQPAYTILLAPGIVRYLPIKLFLEAEIEKWIDLIKKSSVNPQIKVPKFDSYGFGSDVDRNGIDELFPELSWDERLRTHYLFGRLNIERQIPSCIYCMFHSELGLTHLELETCLEAWVREAWTNDDVAESYLNSPNHLVASDNQKCVFLKTPFVIQRLAELEKRAEIESKNEREIKVTGRMLEEQERLRRSRFHTFVYVMEDLRNGHFKIGRSVTPEKRERTLQSEVPQVIMRLSIPAEEKHEKELHDNFAGKRIRGEWFTLDADDLFWVVSFLKKNGDAARASMDNEWFGKICFRANVKTQQE